MLKIQIKLALKHLAVMTMGRRNGVSTDEIRVNISPQKAMVVSPGMLFITPRPTNSSKEGLSLT